jgi:hypothetical protein
MGGCFSSPEPHDVEARQRTQEIDRRLDEDYRRLRKEVKILLLGNSLLWIMLTTGSGESGKSTVLPVLILTIGRQTNENSASRRLQSYRTPHKSTNHLPQPHRLCKNCCTIPQRIRNPPFTPREFGTILLARLI